MQRREFIKGCGAICMGAVGMSALLQSCVTGNYYARTSASDKGIVIKRSEFTYIKKEQVLQRKYVLVLSETYPSPIFLYRQDEDEFSAVLMYCTHKGCDLRPNGNNLLCPCHGSEFSNTGKVLNPPAEKDLKIFQTVVDKQNIYIVGVK